MPTRSGLGLAAAPDRCSGGDSRARRKRTRTAERGVDLFDCVPNDLVLHARSGFDIAAAPARSAGADVGVRRQRARTAKRGVELSDCLPDDLVLHIQSGFDLASAPARGRADAGVRRKRARTAESGFDLFDCLPDDLVLLTLSKLSATAGSPSDLISALVTCRRFNGLGTQPTVLSKVSTKAIRVRGSSWSESAHRFLKRCCDAGNLEASYTLGMIRFYCLGNRGSGASLMAKAAMGSHAAALYSLAVIQFNGSGGSKSDKDLNAGVALCARAAYFGHVDALRELGHCLQDGYGVLQNITEGRRFLVQANARELAASLQTLKKGNGRGAFGACSLLSDFGCNVPASEGHPANMFMVEWFEARGGVGSGDGEGGEGLRLCSHGGCGRPETRRHEFRRCSVCGVVNYCSRACQALHWKLAHKLECAPMDRWLDGGNALPPAVNGGGNLNLEGEGYG